MTTAKNDVTGDTIATKVSSDAYREGWDRIFSTRQKALDELAAQAQELGFYDLPEEAPDNE